MATVAVPDDDVWDLLHGSVERAVESEDSDDADGPTPVKLGRGIDPLCENGIAEFPVAGECLEPLDGLVEAVLEAPNLSRLFNAESGEAVQLESQGKPLPRLRVHLSVGSLTLLWLYPAEDALMELFEPLANSMQPLLSSATSGDLLFCAASLVVLLPPGARSAEVQPHRDWDVDSLPPRSAFTVLAPLRLPLARGQRCPGLEIYDDDGSLAGVYSYERGRAIAFDNRVLHRTEPRRGLTGPRVLASLSFAPTDARWPEAEMVLRMQTPHCYRTPSR